MNCLDCATQDHAMPAVGVCRDCGAGVCLGHGDIRDRSLTRTITIALEVPVEPPARIVRCGVCATAVDAVREASHPRGQRAMRR